MERWTKQTVGSIRHCMAKAHESFRLCGFGDVAICNRCGAVAEGGRVLASLARTCSRRQQSGGEEGQGAEGRHPSGQGDELLAGWIEAGTSDL